MISNHFENKKIHTKIKHKIFIDTFSAILGISSNFSKNNSFTYVDLYAGQGKFSDDSIGSPLLALETISRSKYIHSFHQVKCYFSEKDKLNANFLYEHTKELSKNYSNNKISITIEEGAWSHKSSKLNELLKFSKWGFVFVDPFKNEVELDNLFDLLQNRCKTKDFMLFINTQALKRIAGASENNQYVANFFGVSPNKIKMILKSDETIRNALQKRFSNAKKSYILNASLPTTRKDKLINMDNFQLLLATNSIGVANAFLISYSEAVDLYKKDRVLNFNTLEENIFNIVRMYKKISLSKLIEELYKNNNSWKNADLNNIPTTKNISRDVNILLKRKSMYFETDNDNFVNKKNGYIHLKAYAKNISLHHVYLYIK